MNLKHTTFKDEGWLREFGLHAGNALAYFARSPFWDPECNNVRAGREGRPTESLVGKEYGVDLPNSEPNRIIVWELFRKSPQQVDVVGVFVILEGMVFMGPLLADVVLSRVHKVIHSVQSALDTLRESATFDLGTGFSWDFFAPPPTHTAGDEDEDGDGDDDSEQDTIVHVGLPLGLLDELKGMVDKETETLPPPPADPFALTLAPPPAAAVAVAAAPTLKRKRDNDNDEGHGHGHGGGEIHTPLISVPESDERQAKRAKGLTT